MQLFRLRNITMMFVMVMVLLAWFALGINLPVVPIGLILVTMGVINLVTRRVIGRSREISDRVIFNQLVIDIFSFSLILYFSGGATNPFTFFYLIPLAISATIIPGRRTWILAVLTVGIYSLLLKYYVPLTYFGHEHHDMSAHDGLFTQHIIGMWFGFGVSATLVTWFVTYLSRELKQRDRDIAEARRRELRDQQMITLGTLAAGTAHELGTPLASLAIVTGELTQGYDPAQHPELFADQATLRREIQRCKDILSQLAETVGESRAETGHPVEAQEFVERIVDRWRQQRSVPPCETHLPDGPLARNLIYDQTIAQAMINLLNNSADVTAEKVSINISATEQALQIDILDDGDGFSDEAIAMAGEFSFTSKPHGMGIGLFLALTTLRRAGGDVQFMRQNPAGTCTRVMLPFL
jgi:two-component system sensor histidine kinase RegB